MARPKSSPNSARRMRRARNERYYRRSELGATSRASRTNEIDGTLLERGINSRANEQSDVSLKGETLNSEDGDEFSMGEILKALEEISTLQ